MQSIFMCGCFRSNTSISAYILDHHPRILMSNELCLHSMPLMNQRLMWCTKRRYINPELPHKRFLRDEGDNLSLNHVKLYHKIRSQKGNIDFPTFVEWIKDCKSPEVDLIGEKSPSFLEGKPVHDHTGIYEKFEAFGPVKVICCIRDGRDVICSQVKRWHYTLPHRRAEHRWQRPTVDACLKGKMTWYHYMASWERWKSNTNLPWFELHYGRLIEDMPTEVTKLAEFLGVDAEPLQGAFQQHFKPVSEWREENPAMKLPDEWKKMLELHNFSS